MELQVTDLACARGGVMLLEGLGFRVAPGEALLLRGANGIGKTTLLRTLAGLQPAAGGKISADPESIAYAAHADGLKPALTAAENLRFWAAVHGTGDVGAALAAYRLGPLSDRPAAQLSAGQRRRLGLARLLVAGRAIWLLDEPTVSLDAEAVALFAAVLGAHLAGGGLALMATHLDPGLPAATLDLAPFRARPGSGRAAEGGFGEAFG